MARNAVNAQGNALNDWRRSKETVLTAEKLSCVVLCSVCARVKVFLCLKQSTARAETACIYKRKQT